MIIVIALKTGISQARLAYEPSYASLNPEAPTPNNCAHGRKKNTINPPAHRFSALSKNFTLLLPYYDGFEPLVNSKDTRRSKS